MATKTDKQQAEAMERGRVYFLYRPAVADGPPGGVVDLQRFYMVLRPEGGERARMIVVGHKKLPDVQDGRQKYWGFVDRVVEEAGELAEDLGPAARPAGEGVYALVRHADHAHLAYALQLPERPGEVQAALRIAAEGSYVVAVKNPEASSPPGMGLDEERQAHFPQDLQALFGDRRFIALETPALLDVEGAELLLMGPEANAAEDLGLKLEAEKETAETAHVFEDLRLERSQVTIEPLVKGEWA